MVSEKAEENATIPNNKKKKSAKVKVFGNKKKYNQPESIFIEKLREKYSQVR